MADINRNTKLQFLELLNKALWSREINLSLFSNNTDWKQIYKLSSIQSVQSLVFSSINKLPNEFAPSIDLLQHWLYISSRNKITYQKLNNTLSKIVSILNSNNIHYVLLKGQGVASNYPTPTERMCGDIDIFVGRENYKKVCEIANKLHNGKAEESIQHYHFYLDDIDVEIHRVAKHLNNSSYNRYFLNWSEKMLLKSDNRIIKINDTNINLPAIDFDVFYIFLHAYYHFLLGGIGLRQLCDHALYLHKFHKEINIDLLKKNLNSLGLMDGWKIFGSIAVDKLGLTQNEYPFYDSSYSKKSETVFNMILNEGNFGSENRKATPNNYLLRKLFSCKIHLSRFAKLFPLFPKDVFTNSTYFLVHGMIHFITDINKNRK